MSVLADKNQRNKSKSNMLNFKRFITFIFLSAVSNTNCVSVDIMPPQVETSKEVNYKLPLGYVVFEQEPLDKAWKNIKNGNTISFLSECNGNSEPSPEAVRNSILTGLKEVQIKKEENFNFNKREAFRTWVRASLDGVPTEFQIVILKKNNCLYVITYVGMQKTYEEDLGVFNQFLKDFKIP